MNKKGQALIEFVLILPVFLLLLFSFIDIGRIILCKIHLENTMNDVVLLVNANATIEEINSSVRLDKDYDIDVTITHNYYTNIYLKTDLELITPIMNRVLDNPYRVQIERSILNE